jgi:Arc/MetJ-type ribon-helix-helix transcriptional regulator
MTTLPITLPDSLTTYLQEQIASGNYPTPSDYIQALIQQDQARRTQESEALTDPSSEDDSYETPDETIIEGIRQGLHEAFSGQTIPLSQMWEGIDAD